jgi:hypothetical protein
MGWIIQNLDTFMGFGEIFSGVRRIFFCGPILWLSVFTGCTLTSTNRTDGIGYERQSYSLRWGSEEEIEPAPPRQHISRRRAMREEQDREVASSPLTAKWYK